VTSPRLSLLVPALLCSEGTKNIQYYLHVSDTMPLSLLAGTDESPGQTIFKGGKKVKIIRGMAGYGANMANRQRQQGRVRLTHWI
jgi:IMP dehydrogenase/GMP reductase